MAKEREISLRVDIDHMPNLEHFPSTEIEQLYFTPASANPLFPETDKIEWRSRRITDSNGNITFTTALKLGDKVTGSRDELETVINPGSFGTNDETKDFVFASLLKRRYDLGNGLIVDRYLHAKGDTEYQGEKEFTLGEESHNWGCPYWLSPDPTLPSNRKRAIDLNPKYSNGMYLKHESLSDLLIALDSMVKPAIVTVSGMSGSGKSTIARLINERLAGALIDTDMLHIGVSEIKKRYGSVNHDLIGSYDYEKAAQIARKLSLGEKSLMPVYDYLKGEPTGELKELEPSDSRNVVIDGLYASETAKYLKGINHNVVRSVLVDTPLYVSLIRRMLRDCSLNQSNSNVDREVAFTPEQSLQYLVQTAIPTYLTAGKNRLYDHVIGG